MEYVAASKTMMNIAEGFDQDIDAIVASLSLEEKASLLSGKNFWETMDIPRMGIPSLFLADGPHGIRKQQAAADHLGLNISVPATCFPTAATVANSWDAELLEEMGRYLGREAVAQDVAMLLGPGINIKRNPLCGRNFEYYSEDPYITGKLAAALVRGIQSQGIAACVKHYAMNNQETNRMASNSVVDERALREIYLTAFEMVVKEGQVKTLMTAYNRVNGIYANEHPLLLQEILRKEWEFKGLVVTDWGGSNERVAGLLASSDLEMPGTNGESDREIVQAIREGKLSEQYIDESVARLLWLIKSTQKVLNRAQTELHGSQVPLFDVNAHHEASRRIAEESIVLLKNEDSILPIGKHQRIAIIGDFAQNPRYQGAGSSNVNPTKISSILEEAYSSGIQVLGFARGYDRYGKRNASLKKQALELARQADVVLLCAGLDEASEAEGIDRSHMKLPPNQVELIHELAMVNPSLVVVLSCGSVVEMPWLHTVKGLLHAYLAGQAGAAAILNILTGKVNPSGKLAETYPLRYEDVSSASFFPGREATAEYRESIFVGYRYFDRFPEKVLFPFGFGLSYTRFSYRDLQLSEQGVSFVIQNTGERDGKEIAQLYVRKTNSVLFRPEKELKGFVKVFVRAGEERHVFIPFDEYTFRIFNIQRQCWVVEEGEYELLVGSSSQDIQLKGNLFRSGTVLSPIQDTVLSSVYYHGDPAQATKQDFQRLFNEPLPEERWDRTKPLMYNDTVAQCQYAKSFFARLVFHLIDWLPWFFKKLGKRDKANLIMMSFYYMPFRGIVKMMGGMVNRPMAEALLEIANGHFFKGLKKLIGEFIALRKVSYAKEKQFQ